MSSAPTFTLSKRHSKLCPRRTARKAKILLRSLYATFASRHSEQDYFTGKLPPEIRIVVYRHLFQFGAPLWLIPSGRRRPWLKDLSILFVSRTTFLEGLPVLYALNTISVQRAALCRLFTRGNRQVIGFLPRFVTRLHIRNLNPSYSCAALLNRAWPPCTFCDVSILPLLDSLRTMPKLKEVFIDYHGQGGAIAALRRSLQGDGAGGAFQLSCSGIGQYRLINSQIHFELCDGPLAALWPMCSAIPSARPTLLYLRSTRRIRVDMKRLYPRFDGKDVTSVAVNLLSLLAEQDAGFLAVNLRNIWPADLPKDLRRVPEFTQQEFLFDFNEQLQLYLGQRERFPAA